MDNLKAGFYPFIADYENTHQLGSYTDKNWCLQKFYFYLLESLKF
jgi:hypothetical protein